MIIISQFKCGTTGEKNVVGAVKEKPVKRITYVDIDRGGCVSCSRERRTIFTYTYGKIEYVVVAGRDDVQFELTLGSEDPLPKNIKVYCPSCKRYYK